MEGESDPKHGAGRPETWTSEDTGGAARRLQEAWPRPPACTLRPPGRRLPAPLSQPEPTFFFFVLNSTNYGEGNGSPLQYSCLENPTDRGACWAAVHGVANSQTQLSDFPSLLTFHALEKEMATHSSILA